MTFTEAVARYGSIVNGVWEDETKWCKLVELPPAVQPVLINSATGGPTMHIYCNTDMAPFLIAALNSVVSKGLLSSLRTFDGCFKIRDVRGEPGKPSCHSYALAVDFNAATNRLGTIGDMDPNLVQCFTEQGFSWGGNFARKDYMHFSRAWEG